MIVYQSLLGYLVHLDQTVIIPLQFALQRVQDLLHLEKEKKKGGIRGETRVEKRYKKGEKRRR